MYYLIITAMFFAYLLCFHLFSSLLTPYDYSHSISLGLQIILTALLFAGQLFLWRNKQQLKRIRFKDNTEFFLRRYLLNPLRSLGSVLTIHQHKKATYPLYIITMALTVAGLVYGLLTHGFASQEHAVISHWLVFSFLIVGILTLVAANRCLSIKSLIIYLALFELAFSNLAWFDGSLQIIKIGYFHLITISTVLLMLALLARKSKTPHLSKLENNRLPTRAFYLTFSLLLLIGIPGTSSFVSEFYLMSALVNDNALFILMYISLIVLLAIVVMHSLQLYAFNKNYASLLTKPISLPTHCLFLAVIAVNIAFGLFPNLLLGHL
jgi:NADH:ubiquinone oxidoreductase subunit 4 (subunit M)